MCCMCAIAALGLALPFALTAAALRAEDLPAFLAAADAAARPAEIVRADGELLSRSPAGTRRQQVALVRRPNGDLYVELAPSGVRALLPSASQAQWVPTRNAPQSPLSPATSLPGSDFSAADLQPFDATRWTAPTVVDRTEEEITISCHPTDGSYSLAVLTFDRERHVLLKALLYQENLRNLVKLRRESGHVQVAGAWLPTEISVEHFPLRATSSISLRWATAPELVAVFDQNALTRPSPLHFPDRDAAASGTVALPSGAAD